jgi:cardiolipin synthase
MLHQIPNILTVLRIILIVPFAGFVYRQEYGAALVVFFIAGLSDGVDGFLARQFDWKSRFGAIADPLADKLLLMTAYIVLALTEQIPLWLTAVILGRDFVIVIGALVYHYCISHYDIKPSIWGKACTMAQIVYALALIIKLAGFPMPSWVVEQGIWVVLAITLISGVHYIGAWSVKGLRELRSKSND